MKLGYFVSKKIDQLTKKADSAMQCGEYLKAIAYYKKIIEILPEPKEQWEAFEWSVVSIADTYYIIEDYNKAELYFNKIINTAVNPFIFLRYGQTQYYLNKIEVAKEYLKKAYELEGEEIFKQDDPCFLKLAIESSKATNKIKENDDGFENLFRLPLDYQYLEKEYMSLQYLWKPIDWDEIYNQYNLFFEKIPEELYSNSISFLCASAILESAINLGKTEVFEKWLNVIERLSQNRKDVEVVEIWKGICELYKGNKEEALKFFRLAEERGTDRILKHFRHFGNDIYDFYLKNI
ncbi:tol-pal system YbgF family protein [Longibaculum muris]|uniref:tetratricopeptide repeat protein n=1 Tax=Longibaculum muris TaxID=1796628 RepID=UPI0012B7EA38|nr:tetratricopeptide repeat protein [Longibaculum muris]